MKRATRWTVLIIALFLLVACEDKVCAKMKKNPPKQFMKEIEVSPGESRTIPIAEVFSDLPAACIDRVTKQGPENDEIKAEIKGKDLVVSAEQLNKEDCIDPNAGPSKKDGSVSLKVKTKCETTLSADLKVRVRAPRKLCAQARGLPDQMLPPPPTGGRGFTHIPPGGFPVEPDFSRGAHSF